MPEKSKTKLALKPKTKQVRSVSKQADKKAAKKITKVDDKRYYEAVGRRKQATARVRLHTSDPSNSVKEGKLLINEKPYKEYFKTLALQKKIEAPFSRLKSLSRFRATVKVSGGGSTGQAEAVRHGLSRALILFDDNFRKKLKKSGYLTRDPRKKERKKFGKKKARKSPQWSKR